MAIRKGERWHCQNQECQGEILVIVSSEVEGAANPRCSCGSIMKKPYVRPELKIHPAGREARQGIQTLATLTLDSPRFNQAEQDEE